jgi:hypothetical protein
MTNKQRFRLVVKGDNFVTPKIIRFGQQGDYVYELSTGRGLFNADVFGVTVVDLRTDEHRRDLSQAFFNREEAEDFINDLEKKT